MRTCLSGFELLRNLVSNSIHVSVPNIKDDRTSKCQLARMLNLGIYVHSLHILIVLD
jgi:hypothetical protein